MLLNVQFHKHVDNGWERNLTILAIRLSEGADENAEDEVQ